LVVECDRLLQVINFDDELANKIVSQDSGKFMSADLCQILKRDCDEKRLGEIPQSGYAELAVL
jgi:hypothetical protein